MLIRNTSALETIDKLRDMFNFVGLPTVMVSDNGPPFTSWEFTNWCRLNGIRLIHSPPYHPQTNGLAERFVQDMKELLKRKLVDSPKSNWPDIVREIQADIRFAKTPLLDGNSPAEMIFNYKPNTRFNKLLNMANMTIGSIEYKREDKIKVLPKVGEMILVQNLPHRIPRFQKATVTKQIGNRMVEVKIGHKTRRVHIHQLRPFDEDRKYSSIHKKENDNWWNWPQSTNTNIIPEENCLQSNNTPVLRRSTRVTKPPKRFECEELWLNIHYEIIFLGGGASCENDGTDLFNSTMKKAFLIFLCETDLK